MLNWLMPDDYDGLRLCSVCGDRETRGDVCWVCRQQAAIDASVPADPQQPDFFEFYEDLPGVDDDTYTVSLCRVFLVWWGYSPPCRAVDR
jgi:hypothetical protein